MTIIGTPKLGEFSDPSIPQTRTAVSPSGRQVWVTITQEDRLRLINQLPHRWPEVIKAREKGETLEQIHRWARVALNPEEECRGHCEPPCLRCHMAAIYSWMETELHALAQKRARLYP